MASPGRAILLSAVLLLACTGGTPAVITGREWALTALGHQLDPRGADGRAVTLRLDQADKAGGFAGCNRYGGTYHLERDSIRFGTMTATRMACPDGMALELEYLAHLDGVFGYQATDSTLVLTALDGTVLRFAPAPGAP